MEVEGVIELVSSDDEAEPPAPKKIKPVPNAMVHIPNKIRDITINPVSCKNKLSRKLVTRPSNQIPVVSMLRTNVNARQSKQNVRCLQKITPQPSGRNSQTDKTLQIQNRLNSSPIKIVPRKPLKVGNWNSKQEISSKIISLPSGITVRKTCGGSTTNVGVFKNKIRVNKELANNKFEQPKNKIHPASCLGDILTVELDDDENTSVDKSSSVQWYMRPEEQQEKNKLEEQNNSEPKVREMIEITIEDSPVKPCLIDRAKFDALSITIDDSPVKVLNKPKEADLGSDNEQDKSKSPLSKKKLEYPEGEKSNEVSMEVDSGISVENAPKEVKDSEEIALTTSTKETKEKDGETCDDKPVPPTVDVVQVKDTNQTEVIPKKDNLVDNCNEVEKNNSPDKNIDVSNRINGEFNSIFQQFMDLCLEVDKSEDMKTIVEKRIKTYSRQVPKEFVESEQFLDMVSTKITLIKTEPSKIFLHIKDIVDELKLHRIRKKATPSVNQNNPVEDVENDNKYDRKRRSQIRKLEKTLKKLERAINKLDEQEVDFDDEEDSVYLLNERYKERFVRTYAKFCQLTDTKMLTEPRVVIECRAGQPPGPAKKLEKWINKKVPIGSTLPFPDFHDVIKCVREANTEDKLGWNEADIIDEARDLFTRCGKKLQRRRQENEWRLAASRISQDIDPAERDENLKKKLEENRDKVSKREIELLNKYAQKQNQLHLEPTEIDEKEADNSPVESDDEVDDDSDLLEDSQKRKDRLQRLINEKESMKKNINNKEQQKDFENLYRPETESIPIASRKNEKEIINVKDQDIINVEKGKEIEEKMEIETDFQRRSSAEKVNITTNVECPSEINKDTCVNTRIINNFNKEQILSENLEEIESDESVEKNDVSPKTTVTNLESHVNEEENIHLICDDFYGDELNLLEKLNSGNEVSSPDSSDPEDSPIAISDSLDSGSESEHYETYDVISIGNSSSDNETSDKDKNSSVKNKNTTVENNNTVECANAVTCDLSNKVQSSNNIEAERARIISINEDEFENMHLEYSDDEGYECINIQDNSLTIGETYVGVVENAENTDKDLKSNRCEDDISKDDKSILITNTIKDSVGIEGENKDKDLKNCDNIIKEIDDIITNNDDSRVKKKSEKDTESLSISKKVIEESMSSDDNNGYMANENMQIDSVPFETAKDNVTTMETSGDMIRPQASDEPMTLEESEKPIVPSTKVKTIPKVTPISKSRKENREIAALDASQVSNTKETSGQLRTVEINKESKILGKGGDHVTLELNDEAKILDKTWEAVLLEDNSEIETFEENGQRRTLEASRESLTLDNSWETLLLEDSKDAEADEEIGETKTFEASRESRTLEASGEEMEEPITFDDDDVEPITVEVGEEPKSVEDDAGVTVPCGVQEPEPTTSGVNNNVSSSKERVSPSVQKELDNTFDMVEMMLQKLFNPTN